jgi:hypothetical protein
MFPPSTFPTISLGTPANLTSTTSAFPPLPPPADVNSVLTAIRNSSSPYNEIRQPSEALLQQWSDSYVHLYYRYASDFMICLLHIIDWEASSNSNTNYAAAAGGGIIEDSSRLLAGILLKNCIHKAFSIPLDSLLQMTASDAATSFRDNSNANNESTMELLPSPHIIQQLLNERIVVRQTLPKLLFSESRIGGAAAGCSSNNAILIVHLQLALSNIALFDFPKGWPSLLDDLMNVVVNGGLGGGGARLGSYSSNGMVRVRAIKTLRLCLSSIRQRKIILHKGGVGGGGRGGLAGGRPQNPPIMDMRHLETMIGEAVRERQAIYMKACTIFDVLAEGIVQHAQLAVTGGGSGGGGVSDDIHSAWLTECVLATSHIKCMTELFPMMEIELVQPDPRPAVRSLLDNLTQICLAVKPYPYVFIPPTLVGISSIQQEMTIQMDKLYRSTLVCCMSSIRHHPELFAAQIPNMLPTVVEPILTLDGRVLQSMPVKRLINMTSFILMVLRCALYDVKRCDRSGVHSNAVLSMLMGRNGGVSGGDDGSSRNNDPALMAARETFTALLAEGTIERLIECIVGKFLMLQPHEVEEWESDPEGRFETDLAEEAMHDPQNTKHCGGSLLKTIMHIETDRAAESLLDLTQRVFQQLPQDDINAMLSREACYRALEVCHDAMIGGGKRRLSFSDLFQADLLPILQTDLSEDSPVGMRVIQARAVTLTKAHAQSLTAEEFDLAFRSIARLMAAPDLVTSLCASKSIDHLALISIQDREEGENPKLVAVRRHSVFALGNAFALANRAESEECLRVVLMCVSAMVEVNGVYLEPVLHAIAEQLPPLWERAGDSVPIHSCLLSVLNHLIMKMGFESVENSHVQAVLFPLLDYCTDINVINRAETLLEDGLRLWLVTLLSSKVASMGPRLTSMLPRLEMILRAGLEPHLSLKVLQFNAILLGKQVIEPLEDFLRELLVTLTSRVFAKSNKKDGEVDDEIEMEDLRNPCSGSTTSKERDVGNMRVAFAALNFATVLMQLFPDLGYSISFPAIRNMILYISGVSRNEYRRLSDALTVPLLEAAFSAFCRVVWINPNSLDEIFTQQDDDDSNERDIKITSLVSSWLREVSSVSLTTLMSKKAQTIMFIDRKSAALSLCSAVCHSSTVARVVGEDVVKFTQRLIEAEARSKVTIDEFVEVACGTTRHVVGDGPLGDAANMTAEILKSDPLMTVSLKEALYNAEKAAMAALGASSNQQQSM